jgi:cell wall-associated NlpC family hydrolase
MLKKQNILLFCSALLVSGFFISCHSHRKNTDTGEKKTAHVSSAKIKTIAAVLGVSEKEVRDKKLYEFVSEWYGVPYKYGGCSKSGTDCSCLTINLYSTVYKKQLPRSADDMAKACSKVKESKAEEGDMVFFKINSKTVSHVGVVLKNNKFIHASTSKGVLISDLNEAYYKKFFYCFGRL